MVCDMGGWVWENTLLRLPPVCLKPANLASAKKDFNAKQQIATATAQKMLEGLQQPKHMEHK